MLPNLNEIKAHLGDLLFKLRIPMYRREAVTTIGLGVVVLVVSISTTMLGTQGFLGVYQVLMERAQFPMIRAEIESLRKDAASTPCEQAVMLRATVAAVNQRIEHEHESNRHWFSDWASTDRWQGVERIAFRCKQ